MDKNYLSALNAINRSQPVAAVNKSVQSPAATTTGNANFQQLLMGLLLSGLSSTSADTSSTNNLFDASASSSASSSSNSITSVLVNMIEQLLASQLNTLQANNNASGKSTTTDLTGQSGGGVPYSVLSGINPPTPSTPSIEKNSPEGRPVQGVLTQGFHSTHHALDFGVVVGTPVHATMDGKVVYAGWNTEGYGNLVIVQNGDYKTYFAHLSNIPVSLNQSIKAGSVVGLSGNTGNSTGPHLHYEVRKNNVAIDPTGFTLNQK
jgi:murein DD-endopeptidase MepM/ murein hydrolase activator NlpD